MQEIAIVSLDGVSSFVLAGLEDYNEILFAADDLSHNMPLVSGAALNIKLSADGVTFPQTLKFGSTMQHNQSLKSCAKLSHVAGVGRWENFGIAVPPPLPSPTLVAPSENNFYAIDMRPGIVAVKFEWSSGAKGDSGVIRVRGV